MYLPDCTYLTLGEENVCNERMNEYSGQDMCGVSSNGFNMCRGSERGTARPEVLEALLSTTDRVVQEVDSVEYGLTDIQEYYANTGTVRLCSAPSTSVVMSIASVASGGLLRQSCLCIWSSVPCCLFSV